MSTGIAPEFDYKNFKNSFLEKKRELVSYERLAECHNIYKT
jgi:hypothetical protein